MSTYEFTCNRRFLTVLLHDDAGKEIGSAIFREGLWRTDSEAEAVALLASAKRLAEYAIECVKAPAPAKEAQAAADAPKPHSNRKGK